MRIAVISDIHSNLEALTEVLRAVEAQKVDRVVSLGDIVGYGASPNECCELVRNVAEVTLLGNHDAAVAGRMDYSFYYEARPPRPRLVRPASLSEENLAWLRSLPYTYRMGEIGFCHGSPVDPRAYEYVFALEQARELVPDVRGSGRGDVHRPQPPVQGLRPRQRRGERRGGAEVRVPARLPVHHLGGERGPAARLRQPGLLRHLRHRRQRRVEYIRVEYDIESAAQSIFEAELALNFGKRLFLGV